MTEAVNTEELRGLVEDLLSGPEGKHDPMIRAIMREAADRLAAQKVENERLRGEVSTLRGHQQVPLIDQDGKTIGVAYRSFDELHREEVHVDESGTAWTRPTAWAYMQACRANEKNRAQADALAGFLSDVMDHFATRMSAPGNAFSHAHAVAGIWDVDPGNGAKGGTPCEWCAKWNAAAAALATHRKANPQ